MKPKQFRQSSLSARRKSNILRELVRSVEEVLLLEEKERERRRDEYEVNHPFLSAWRPCRPTIPPSFSWWCASQPDIQISSSLSLCHTHPLLHDHHHHSVHRVLPDLHQSTNYFHKKRMDWKTAAFTSLTSSSTGEDTRVRQMSSREKDEVMEHPSLWCKWRKWTLFLEKVSGGFILRYLSSRPHQHHTAIITPTTMLHIQESPLSFL